MRHRALAVAAVLWALPAVADHAPIPASEIIKTFEHYERINADFLSSVESGKGKSGKTYAQLRTEAEAYAEGPFESALDSAVRLVCGKRNTGRNTDVVRALFKVKVATRNSASESPSTALGQMFVCQPTLVSAQFRAETPEMQRLLYPALEFGFENAVYPTTGKDVDALRMSLKVLEPKSK